ncbi:MAG: hypothetical protein ACKN9U_24950, partial [Pirellulaceae bacterium]
FSDSSFGSRLGRNTHQALDRAKEHIASGHRWVVDMDYDWKLIHAGLAPIERAHPTILWVVPVWQTGVGGMDSYGRGLWR